jgi:hypothetical protein
MAHCHLYVAGSVPRGGKGGRAALEHQRSQSERERNVMELSGLLFASRYHPILLV